MEARRPWPASVAPPSLVAMLRTPPRAAAPFLAALPTLAALGGPASVAAQGVQPRGPGSGEPGPDLSAADSLVAAWVSSGRIPGAVLLVLRDGEAVLEGAYGYAFLMEYADGEYGAAQAGQERPGALRRLADPVPMTMAAAFDLASVTKVMATTFALMLPVDRGEMDLDAPVWRYLPDFRGGGKDAITPRHLLSHTSGLQQWVPTYYHASEADAAYAYVRDLPLGWPVGEGRRYPDLGFMVLGRIVEQVAVLLTNRQHLGVDGRGLYPDLGAPQRGVAPELLRGAVGTEVRGAMKDNHEIGRILMELVRP